jgi:hypothetical protein
MKLKTADGQEFVLGPGCVIGFYRKEKYIVLMSKSGDGSRLKWQNDDDKRFAPACVQTEQDFYEIVKLIAAVMGLRAEKDSFERTYGPAYLLIE